MRKRVSSETLPVFSDCVDFHTHILPQMDDGSRSAEESIRMLEALYTQGVFHVVLTPHFYADGDTPERFFDRRRKSFSLLRDALASIDDIHLPQLTLGAEVEYFEGISDVECMADFAVGESGRVLLEMPMGIWSSRVVDDVLSLNDRNGCRVILAHVERYLFDQKKDVVHTLLRNGIVMQSNASFFINKKTSKKAVRLLKDGMIHLIGSDCHNMVTRPPNMLCAMSAIVKAADIELLDDAMAHARCILGLDA